MLFSVFAFSSAIGTLLLASIASVLSSVGWVVLAGGWPPSLGELSQRAQAVTDPATTTGLVIGLVPTALAFILASVSLARIISPIGTQVFALTRPRALDVVVVSAGMLAWSTALGALVALTDLAQGGMIEILRDAFLRLPFEQRLALLPASALLPGLGEELFFRGLLLGTGEALVGRRAGIVVSALLFGLVHLDPVHSSVALLMGLYLGFARGACASIVPMIAAHVVNNTVATLWPDLGGSSEAVQWALLAGGTLVGLATIGYLIRRSRPLVQGSSR